MDTNPDAEMAKPTVEFSFPIAILGGGFAGAYCARALASALGEGAAKTVALLADQNFILFHPMLAEVSGSSISPLHVLNSLRRFCRGISFLLGTVDQINPETKTVFFSPGPYVGQGALHYEHLVLALGSVVDTSRIPGMAEHGYLMKTVGDAIHLRADLLDRLEEASLAANENIRRRMLTFVVVGGGYSGVETAGQLLDLVRDAQKFYPRLKPKEFRFVLVHSGSYLLPQIGEGLGRYAEKQLRERGIEILLNSRVTALTAERAILGSAQMIETNTVVTTVGNAPHPVLERLFREFNVPNEHGRIATDQLMQVKGFPNLWTAGDCAAVPDKTGQISPATAQFAMRQGTVLGKNLAKIRRGEKPEPFQYKTLGEMASLGHRNAVGKVLGFQVSGFLGWLMWRATYLYKLPGLEDKIKVFVEWNLDLLFPRDISLLNVRTTNAVGKVHLEKGDPVYHVGDPAFSFYVVEKGQLKLSDTSGVSRIIGPGEHFGERELLLGIRRTSNVEALQPSSLVALDRHTFETLAQNSTHLGYFFRRSSIRYLKPEERQSLVNRAAPPLKEKKAGDFVARDQKPLMGDVSIVEALRLFKSTESSMLPVVDASAQPKGWLRLDFVFDALHLGEATPHDAISRLKILPATLVLEDQPMAAVLDEFSRTPDRAFIVTDPNGKYVGTLALLDVVLASQNERASIGAAGA